LLQEIYRRKSWCFRPKQLLQPLQILAEKIFIHDDLMTILSDEQKQLSASAVWFVMLVDSPDRVIDDIEVEQKAMLHASLFLERLKVLC